MRLTEPVTMLTDYLLAGLCLYFAASIASRSSKLERRKTGLWVAAFVMTALAALAGGTAHGFRIPLGDFRSIVWSLTVSSIAAGSVLLIAAGVDSALHPDARSETSRREGVSWLKRAVVVTLASLALLVGKVSFHEHFNQNDLYHVVQMVGLYFLYRGALLLRGLVGGSRPRGDNSLRGD
jgi:ribose/xylose/arabinose/galactoside ABC-type transport system permease subunit